MPKLGLVTNCLPGVKIMVDKNGSQIEIGDMVQFKEIRYASALGIIEKFSSISKDHIFVAVCGGGGRGRRMTTASKCKKIESLD